MTDLIKKMDNNFLASFVGLDRMFESLGIQSSYLPYDLVKLNDNKYILTLALAGFDKEDIDIYLHDDTLEIRGKKNENNKNEDEKNGIEYIHKGIGKRSFTFRIGLTPWCEIEDAKMHNGLLSVAIVVEQKNDSQRKIEITD